MNDCWKALCCWSKYNLFIYVRVCVCVCVYNIYILYYECLISCLVNSSYNCNHIAYVLLFFNILLVLYLLKVLHKKWKLLVASWSTIKFLVLNTIPLKSKSFNNEKIVFSTIVSKTTGYPQAKEWSQTHALQHT